MAGDERCGKARLRRVYVGQGEFAVGKDPGLVLWMVLGSCVAVCVWDAEAGVGGANHIVLPRGHRRAVTGQGVHLMELLINAMMKAGARKERLQAKLLGGADMAGGGAAIGTRNAGFARSFLATEGIVLAGEKTGGTRARRVEFFPATGRVRQMLLDDVRDPPAPAALEPVPAPEVELF